jgi:hypothetical protein
MRRAVGPTCSSAFTLIRNSCMLRESSVRLDCRSTSRRLRWSSVRAADAETILRADSARLVVFLCCRSSFNAPQHRSLATRRSHLHGPATSLRHRPPFTRRLLIPLCDPSLNGHRRTKLDPHTALILGTCRARHPPTQRRNPVLPRASLCREALRRLRELGRPILQLPPRPS